MKVILIAIFLMLGFNACSSSVATPQNDNSFYERANHASERSLNSLDKE